VVNDAASEPGEAQAGETDGAHGASRRRTLLMVTPYFPPGGGGLEQYVFRLAIQLQRRHNWRVVVATSGDRRIPDRWEIADGLTIYRLGYIFKISNTPLDPRWVRRLRSIIERENPDLVNAHLPVPGLADAMAHVVGTTPFVVTYHTNTMLKGKLHYDIPIWLYERIIRHRILARAERIICSSTAVRDFLEPYAGKCLVIPPAVDLAEFAPGAGPVGRRLLFVGILSRSHSHKGLHFLLEALAEAPCRRVCLDVVGDGDARSFYEEQCRRLGIGGRVRFHGRLSGTALVTRYKESYALVQPSTNDSFPATVVEAMACGLPVIASDVGGIPSLVRDGVTGRLVPPADVASLARAVEELFSDPATAIKRGQAGRALVESHLTVQEQADRTEAVFEEILERSCGCKVAVVTPHFGGLENYVRHNRKGTLRDEGSDG
jgi:glycosyltransferase involved in cell wall biosynthesis